MNDSPSDLINTWGGSTGVRKAANVVMAVGRTKAGVKSRRFRHGAGTDGRGISRGCFLSSLVRVRGEASVEAKGMAGREVERRTRPFHRAMQKSARKRAKRTKPIAMLVLVHDVARPTWSRDEALCVYHDWSVAKDVHSRDCDARDGGVGQDTARRRGGRVWPCARGRASRSAETPRTRGAREEPRSATGARRPWPSRGSRLRTYLAPATTDRISSINTDTAHATYTAHISL